MSPGSRFVIPKKIRYIIIFDLLRLVRKMYCYNYSFIEKNYTTRDFSWSVKVTAISWTRASATISLCNCAIAKILLLL